MFGGTIQDAFRKKLRTLELKEVKMAKRFHIVVNVHLERYVKGISEVFDMFDYTVEHDVESRRSTYLTLVKEFGRCFGSIPMGYKFGKKIKWDDGTEGFEYSRVTIISGATYAPGFVLKEVK
jgi:hypothetical protein